VPRFWSSSVSRQAAIWGGNSWTAVKRLLTSIQKGGNKKPTPFLPQHVLRLLLEHMLCELLGKPELGLKSISKLT
jgi:hypothetical protein